METKKVLILGASGYVGSQLIPLLLDAGHKVTATARNLPLLKSRIEVAENLSFEQLDLSDNKRTLQIVDNFDLVYFLVHGMNHGHDFLDYELDLAQNFAQALQQNSIGQVIYLSSLQPQTGHSEHLAARRKTGEILRNTPVPIIELRAGVIIGPGSAAFEIMRDFVYNLPILITPKWVDSKANPIALKNLNHYLLSLACESNNSSKVYEVGGPDILSYRDQFKTICHATNNRYSLFATKLLTPSMAAAWLGIVTSVPSSIGRALLAGLSHDFIADSAEIRQRFPQQLMGYKAMVDEAISHEDQYVRSKVWGFDSSALSRWQSGFGYYAKNAGASYKTSKTTQQLWDTVIQLGSPKQGYFFANFLWRTREWLDLFVGGGRPKRRVPAGPKLKVGDHIDSWKVIRIEDQKFLSLLFGMKGPGLGRLECSIVDHGDYRELDVRAWWHPKGFFGLLYWWAMFPAHLFIFKGMVRAICNKSNLDSDNSQG
ncbi:SDR family oxidoreductase [Vibrio gallicus]|uniref:SDR family oxidoreductase n=1 Tax=Vibrio gallicus TaxID=190897 RepID=UPI0021C2CD43|nr:SDR family oxidoreductase [Vibrio gallicus]